MPAPINTTRIRKYRDLDLDMLVHPMTKDIVGRSDVDAINGSIIRIIKTQRGERVFQSAFGSTIYHSLFEPMSLETRVVLEGAIEQAIRRFEKRCILKGVQVEADPDRNGYSVSIVYVPVNEGSPVALDFFLNRLR
jgi:phage baseplate assembly protein W|tara:strand:+ start:10570 stop:10977 length:408 start_codon:yes stop_codon:yes gene_type:complete